MKNKNLKYLIRKASLNTFMITLLTTGMIYGFYNSNVSAASNNGFYNFISFEPMDYFKQDSDHDGIIDMYDKNPNKWNITDRDLRFFQELAYRSEDELNAIFNRKDEAAMDKFNNDKLLHAVDIREISPYWRFVKQVNKSNGFSASIFSIGDQAVLAIRGTDGGNDWDDDTNILFRTEPGQASDAKNMYYELRDFSKIYVTGHSLGGYLATYYSATAGYVDDERFVHGAAFNAPGVALSFVRSVTNKAYEMTHTPYIDDSDSRYIDQKNKMQYYKVSADTVGGVFYVDTTRLFNGVNSGNSHSSTNFFPTKRSEELKKWFSTGYRYDNVFLPDDSDNDGIVDYDELRIGTDPKKKDSDNDGYSDKLELSFATNPISSDEHPLLSDFYNFVPYTIEFNDSSEVTKEKIRNRVSVVLKNEARNMTNDIPTNLANIQSVSYSNYPVNWSEQPKEGYNLNVNVTLGDGSTVSGIAKVVIRNNPTLAEIQERNRTRITISEIENKIFDSNPVAKPEINVENPYDQSPVITMLKKNGDRFEVISTFDSIDELTMPNNAGEYQIKAVIENENEFKAAQASRDFTISKKDNSFSTPLSIENWTEGDEPKSPVAVVSHNNDRIKFLYSSNRDSGFEETVPTSHGTYYVKAVVDGDENYNSLESEPIELRILERVEPVAKKDNSFSTPLSIENWTEGDEPKAPVAVVSHNNDRIKFLYSSNRDSGFEETVPTSHGTYYVKAVVDGDENYNSLESEPVEFSILERDNSGMGEISNSVGIEPPVIVETPITPKDEINESNRTRITIYEIESKTYDSNPVAKPEISVENPYDQSPVITILKKNGDRFDVISTFNSLDELTMPNNAGEYQIKAVIENENEFKAAQASREFTIRKKDNSFSTPLSIENWTEGDEPKAPVAVASHNNDRIKFLYSSNRDSGFEENVPASHGTYYVKAVVDGDENYNSLESEPIEFSILERVEPVAKKDNSFSTPLSIENWTEGDEPKAPVAVVSHNNDRIKFLYSSNRDSGFEENVPTSHGTYYVKAVVDGDENYNSLESEPVEFSILERIDPIEDNKEPVIDNTPDESEPIQEHKEPSIENNNKEPIQEHKEPSIENNNKEPIQEHKEPSIENNNKEPIQEHKDPIIEHTPEPSLSVDNKQPEILKGNTIYISNKKIDTVDLSSLDPQMQSIKISQQNFKSSDIVIIVNKTKNPDILSATSLSSLMKAPILLTDRDKATTNLLDEIKRLGAKEIIFIGGDNSISPELLDKFVSQKISRIFGKDRYETSAQIAQYIHNKTGHTEKAFIASGEVFADSALITPQSGREKSPILLTKKNAIPNATKNILSKLGVKKSVVIGGRDTISSSVEDRLKADERIYGKDRYDTGRKIYKKYFDNSKEVWFTPGDNFVLSLLVSSAASAKGAPILYYHDNNAASDISSYVDNMDSRAKITVFED